MYISKRKQEKRREEYRKAVQHKMESAANLADKYANVYESSSEERRDAYRRNQAIVNRKLLYVMGGVLLQSLVLIVVISLVFMPFKDDFVKLVDDYFGEDTPVFSVVRLKDNYSGSDNTKKPVYYSEIERPEANTCYAVITGEKISSKVYYGMSDQALLSGVAHLSTTSLPGLGEPVLFYGYSWTYFSGLEETEIGDKITVTTNYGVYKYEVNDVLTFKSSEKKPYNLEEEKEKLILCSDSPFGAYKTEKGETFCVIAEKVSGPEIVY